MEKEISVVIPAYNEEKRLPGRIEEITTYLENSFDYEIIIIDDGSKDNTIEIAKSFMKTNKKIKLLQNRINKGKGYSIKKGMLFAKKELVLFTDADNSSPIKEIDKLLRYIKDYDIVIGSRAMINSDIRKKQPIYKRLLGRIGNKLIRFFASLDIKDTQCGFKLFNRKSIDVFKKQTIDRWGFDFEILFIAKKKGYKIKEVPITWINDERSKLKIKDYFKTFIELLKIKINDINGKY